MNPPVQDLPPDPAQRVADTVEFLARIAGAALIVWGFIAKAGKPYFQWRQKQFSATIRAVLKEELACLAQLTAREEEINAKLDLALERQERVFDELDLFVAVLADSRDRLDEVKDLLNEAGYASRDRRIHSDRRVAADEAMAELQGRLRGRRRQEDHLEERSL